MIDINQFAKKSNRPQLKTTPYCVIYTRVSTKEQAEGNYSLDTQKRDCEAYALKKGYIIEQYFGGTYESAKSDERLEFKRMLNFIQKSTNRISYVIVAYPDRFSRSGTRAISIVDDLKSKGILVESVYQNTDSSTQSGQMMQNIQLIFSNYENNNRKEKSVNGMIAKMERGYIVGQVPKGYRYVTPEKGEEQKVVFTDESQFVKKAFLWKSQGVKTSEIVKRLHGLGFNMNEKYLSKLFRNPFYVGLIAHQLLDGKLVNGKHPALITMATFLKAQEQLSVNGSNYKTNPEDEHLPLKRLIKCGDCDTNMTGYLVKTKGKYYYKCNTKGCKNNRSAAHLHTEFENLLNKYVINTDLKPLLNKQLVYTYEFLNQESKDEQKLILKQLSELATKIENLERKYIEDDLPKELFLKYSSEYTSKQKELTEKLNSTTNQLSNPQKDIKAALEKCENLSKMWQSARLDEKTKIQNIVFPNGLIYDRRTDDYRTPKPSLFIELITSFSSNSIGIKKGDKVSFENFSPSVAGSRIELPTLGL